MLSHCANPQCSTPFLRLRQGKLFLVGTDGSSQPGKIRSQPASRKHLQQRVERYWLCDLCSQVWTLVQDRARGIALVRLPRLVASAEAVLGGMKALLHPEHGPDAGRQHILGDRPHMPVQMIEHGTEEMLLPSGD
jgi:hypothetical protein